MGAYAHFKRRLMTDYHLGPFHSINAFVADKLKSFSTQGLSFETLFSLMFRERENILYERSEGYRIRKTTYGEAREAILAMAAALRRRFSDIPAGEVVGLYMDNSLAWIECFWAILAAGYRPLLMNLRLPPDLLAEAMAACSCRAVVSDGRRFDVPTVIADELTDGAPEEPDRAFGTELLVMSSGTSEHVKVCAFTAKAFYYQICDSYDIIQECAKVKEHWDGELKLLAFLPFYHVFGLIAMYLWFGFFSRTFVHLADLEPQTILNTIRRHKVTHIFAVPLFWEKVYTRALAGIRERGEDTWNKFQKAMDLRRRLPGAMGDAFSRLAFREVRENLFGESIRFMITGGSFIDPRILDFFNGIGYRLANGYGMTEIGITSVELSNDRKWLCGGYIGKPMTHAEYRLDDEGQLWVRGEITSDYILCDGVRTENDGWFCTRDLAECREGHYLLRGRRDDLIVGPDGENINPNLIEPRLRSDDAAVCLIPLRQEGKTVPVLLAEVNRYLPQQRLKEIENGLKRRLAEQGLTGAVSRIVLLGEPLMRPEEIKPNRVRLARELDGGRLRVLDPNEKRQETAAGELEQKVRSCFAAALDRSAGEIGLDADFFTDLGGSSLDYFAAISALKETFGLPFPQEGGNLRSVGEIADYIRRNQGNE